MRAVLFSVLMLFVLIPKIYACESCSISTLGQKSLTASKDKFFAEYYFEQDNYNTLDASYAHTLHHQNHHLHDKISEDIHHVVVGAHLWPRLTMTTEIPYVERRSIEIDSHAHLGTNELSKGLGDVQLIGQYDIVYRPKYTLGIFSGVKFPTGNTKELNSVGDLFEAELQPGSGSYDYVGGVAGQWHMNAWDIFSNASYTKRNYGIQETKFGDVMSTTLLIGHAFALKQIPMTFKPSLKLNYQYETRQKESGTYMEDSGGQTLLAGPELAFETGRGFSLMASYLSPVVQNLGGVHQELDYIYTVGGRINF